MSLFSINVNGVTHEIEAEPQTPLLWILRDTLKLKGTKFGCGISQCGACTIHLDGQAVRSCALTLEMLEEEKIVTIEGLSEHLDHPVQIAWKQLDVPQCGYCQAGQMMTAAALLEENPKPSTEEIRNAMHGNICRCSAYSRIEKAVALAAKNLNPTS
ncbi:(2Fe-2S)-binding protein [Persicobacter diffluens]|uniref:(2Fe-2S)-binding protein n=1 Tax=Persicobacter diffluens TaxID=981 RepID=A0AAN5AL23_9BACT|nr:(2Fe-2S)-binding protein [Persicobacter diffluens]